SRTSSGQRWNESQASPLGSWQGEAGSFSHIHQSLFQLPPSTWCAAVAVPQTKPSGNLMQAPTLACGGPYHVESGIAMRRIGNFQVENGEAPRRERGMSRRRLWSYHAVTAPGLPDADPLRRMCAGARPRDSLAPDPASPGRCSCCRRVLRWRGARPAARSGGRPCSLHCGRPPSEQRPPAGGRGAPCMISIVIQGYQEEGRIGSTVRAIAGTVAHEVVVVANGCTDGTAVAAQRAGARVI